MHHEKTMMVQTKTKTTMTMSMMMLSRQTTRDATMTLVRRIVLRWSEPV